MQLPPASDLCSALKSVSGQGFDGPAAPLHNKQDVPVEAAFIFMAYVHT